MPELCSAKEVVSWQKFLIKRKAAGIHLREFVQNRHPNLQRECSGVAHHAPWTGSGRSGSVHKNRVLEDPYRSCALGRFEMSKT